MTDSRTKLDKHGCEFGRHLNDRMKYIEKAVDRIEESVEKLSNHYSRRLPLWANIIGYVAFFIIGVMATIIVGLL